MKNVVPLPSSNQPIFVLQVRPSPKLGDVKAYADIQYYGATIHGFSIVQKQTDIRPWVGFPCALGKNGKRFPIVEFSEPERSQIAKLILDAAKELL